MACNGQLESAVAIRKIGGSEDYTLLDTGHSVRAGARLGLFILGVDNLGTHLCESDRAVVVVNVEGATDTSTGYVHESQLRAFVECLFERTASLKVSLSSNG